MSNGHLSPAENGKPRQDSSQGLSSTVAHHEPGVAQPQGAAEGQEEVATNTVGKGGEQASGGMQPEQAAEDHGSKDAMRRPSKQLVLKEDKAQGHVTFATYYNYARSGGLPLSFACLGLFAAAQGGQMASDYLLQYWASRADDTQEDDRYIQRYVILTLCTTLAALLNSTLFFILTARANSNLHFQVS